jgi:hypothetical protein
MVELQIRTFLWTSLKFKFDLYSICFDQDTTALRGKEMGDQKWTLLRPRDRLKIQDKILGFDSHLVHQAPIAANQLYGMHSILGTLRKTHGGKLLPNLSPHVPKDT